jgi:hypothetical protein
VTPWIEFHQHRSERRMQIHDAASAGERRRQPPRIEMRRRGDLLAKRNQQCPVASHAYPHVTAIVALVGHALACPYGNERMATARMATK